MQGALASVGALRARCGPRHLRCGEAAEVPCTQVAQVAIGPRAHHVAPPNSSPTARPMASAVRGPESHRHRRPLPQQGDEGLPARSYAARRSSTFAPTRRARSVAVIRCAARSIIRRPWVASRRRQDHSTATTRAGRHRPGARPPQRISGRSAGDEPARSEAKEGVSPERGRGVAWAARRLTTSATRRRQYENDHRDAPRSPPPDGTAVHQTPR